MAQAADDGKLYKIGEVCRLADVQPYVLRYWETEFSPLVPNKSGGGQRLYSQREIDIIMRIKQLLYSEGFTIAGAKKKLDAEMIEPAPAVAAAKPPPEPVLEKGRAIDAVARKALRNIREELSKILALLDD